VWSSFSPLPPAASTDRAKQKAATYPMDKPVAGPECAKTILHGAYNDSCGTEASDSATAGLARGLTSYATVDYVNTLQRTDEQPTNTVAAADESQREDERLEGQELPETLEVAWFEPDLSAVCPEEPVTKEPNRADFLESAEPQATMLVDAGEEKTPAPGREDTDQGDQDNNPARWPSAPAAP